MKLSDACVLVSLWVVRRLCCLWSRASTWSLWRLKCSHKRLLRFWLRLCYLFAIFYRDFATLMRLWRLSTLPRFVWLAPLLSLILPRFATWCDWRLADFAVELCRDFASNPTQKLSISLGGLWPIMMGLHCTWKSRISSFNYVIHWNNTKKCRDFAASKYGVQNLFKTIKRQTSTSLAKWCFKWRVPSWCNSLWSSYAPDSLDVSKPKRLEVLQLSHNIRLLLRTWNSSLWFCFKFCGLCVL
jgi:hypothetical protein